MTKSALTDLAISLALNSRGTSSLVMLYLSSYIIKYKTVLNG